MTKNLLPIVYFHKYFPCLQAFSLLSADYRIYRAKYASLLLTLVCSLHTWAHIRWNINTKMDYRPYLTASSMWFWTPVTKSSTTCKGDNITFRYNFHFHYLAKFHSKGLCHLLKEKHTLIRLKLSPVAFETRILDLVISQDQKAVSKYHCLFRRECHNYMVLIQTHRC